MRDIKFALGMCLFTVGMVVAMAAFAAGCVKGGDSTTLRNVEVDTFKHDGACFLVAYNRNFDHSFAVVNYPCPKAKEQLL